MDSEQRVEQWNARWMIVAGRVVCTGCLESQALVESESQFFHAHACKTYDETSKHPWIALHDILDCARG